MPIFIFKIRNKFNPIVIPTLSKLKMINKIGRFSALNPKRGMDQIVSKTIIIPMMEIKDGFGKDARSINRSLEAIKNQDDDDDPDPDNSEPMSAYGQVDKRKVS